MKIGIAIIIGIVIGVFLINAIVAKKVNDALKNQ